MLKTMPVGLKDKNNNIHVICSNNFDCRIKTIDVGREIKTTEMVVRYHLKKLIQRAIIIGFKPFLNVHKLNAEFYSCIQYLRLKFGEIIKDYEFVQYTQEYKFTYLPEMF